MTKEELEQLTGQIVWAMDRFLGAPVPLRLLPPGELSKKFFGVLVGTLTTDAYGNPERTGWKHPPELHLTEAEAWLALLKRSREQRAEAKQEVERHCANARKARENLSRIRREGELSEKEVVAREIKEREDGR